MDQNEASLGQVDHAHGRCLSASVSYTYRTRFVLEFFRMPLGGAREVDNWLIYGCFLPYYRVFTKSAVTDREIYNPWKCAQRP